MSARANHWKLGLFVVAGTLIGLAALLWRGASALGRETEELLAFFDESVQGLDAGSPVKFRGVTIGAVKDIGVAPDLRTIQVVVSIYLDVLERLGLGDAETPAQVEAQRRMRAQLVSAGITGQKFIQVDLFENAPTPHWDYGFEQPTNWAPTVKSSLKTLEETLIQTAESFPRALDEVRALARSVNVTMDVLRRAGEIVEAESEPLHVLLVRAESLAAALERDLAASRLSETTASVRSASEAMNRAALDAGGVLRDSGRLADEVRVSAIELRDTLDAIRALAVLLERDPGVLLRGREDVSSAPARTP